jgi:hypothetical protein
MQCRLFLFPNGDWAFKTRERGILVAKHLPHYDDIKKILRTEMEAVREWI